MHSAISCRLTQVRIAGLGHDARVPPGACRHRRDPATGLHLNERTSYASRDSRRRL